ncbi:Der1-like protein [Meira miltonrushii]|uniref:Derlin n=1 Tax=Meira miltonrushii TaxID=1280837 RepID=A0A316VEF3_9BASI|nr:Der1-like protein [Meira miltonrushii]PWN35999.1 Der1-like protein [Meira miltonrushii]
MDLDSIPPITRLWAGSALALALAEHVGLVSSLQLFLSFRLVLKGQIWRIPTSLAYFGPFSIDFLFNLLFTTRYARMLEENHYAGHRADFVWLLIFSSTILVLLSPLATLPFLGSPLGFVLVYIWSRRNRHVRLSLFGVLVITAPYLPWALVAFSWVLAGSPKYVIGDLLGIAVGHLYYFLVDIWPREVKSGGRNLLATPRILVRLIDGR